MKKIAKKLDKLLALHKQLKLSQGYHHDLQYCQISRHTNYIEITSNKHNSQFIKLVKNSNNSITIEFKDYYPTKKYVYSFLDIAISNAYQLLAQTKKPKQYVELMVDILFNDTRTLQEVLK